MMSAIDTTNRSVTQKRFFSLKWKTFLVLSAVLAFVNAIFYGFHYFHLHKRYVEERAELNQRNLLILESVTKQRIAVIQHFASIVPSLFGLEKVIDANDWIAVKNTLHTSWPNIQAEYAVDRILFFDENQKIVVDANFDPSLHRTDDRLSRYAKTVKDLSAPSSFIDCHPRCYQVALVPVLSQKNRFLVIAVYSSIAEIVLDYKNITGVDIGVLVPKVGKDDLDSTVDRWGLNAPVLTNAPFLIPYLNRLADKGAVADFVGREYQDSYFDSVYETKIISSPLLAIDTNGFVVLIENVTSQVEGLKAISKESLLLVILGLIVAEVALLALLWSPLSRLKRTSLNLPLLANGEFEVVRKNLSTSRNKPRFAINEIDLVSNSAIDLSFQLERLNQDVAQYTKTLAHNVGELRHERDFIRRLLDTAQLLIVTHDSRGHVVQVNRHAVYLLGVAESEVIGKSYEALFIVDRERLSFIDSIKTVRTNSETHLRTENSLLSPFGNKSIAWVHSKLNDAESAAALVLSVGLDISERKESEKRIAWLANHDPLTGLYNRRHFNELFEAALKQCLRYGRRGALLYLDLDNFKYINDTQGHNAGDRLIVEVSTALRKITRETDIVARIGGDEFAIVIQDVDKTGIVDFCKDLNRRIGVTTRPRIRGTSQTTASIGVALFPLHGKTVEDLLANADIAMYQAKDRGKGGWHIFAEHEQAREKLQHQINWKEKIDLALSTDNFLLYFQPILDIRENKITHYEVLLRMRDQNGNILSPQLFIEIAENTGLIGAIDQLVIAKTLRVLRSMGPRARDLKFSINLSARTFSDRKLLPLLERALKSHDVPKQNLIFEITETAALQDISAACDAIELLQSMGCQIAIDDFGVGFSSFYYLRELPVDYVKIDGSFIQQLASNPDDQLIVRAMSQIAKGFGKKTIAEYVEDEATLSILKKFRIDYAQGFFIGVPSHHDVLDLEVA